MTSEAQRTRQLTARPFSKLLWANLPASRDRSRQLQRINGFLDNVERFVPNAPGVLSGAKMKEYFMRVYGVDPESAEARERAHNATGKDLKLAWDLSSYDSVSRIIRQEYESQPAENQTHVVTKINTTFLILKSVDLLAKQSEGVRWGGIATKTMGQTTHDVVQVPLYALRPLVRARISSLTGDNPPQMLTFYVPRTYNGRHNGVISEAGILNGVYTAKGQGLSGYGYADNWQGQIPRNMTKEMLDQLTTEIQ